MQITKIPSAYFIHIERDENIEQTIAGNRSIWVNLANITEISKLQEDDGKTEEEIGLILEFINGKQELLIGKQVTKLKEELNKLMEKYS
jgi:hypothetical protein